jgi:exodeoxyribonuclease V alpha subunit
VHGGTLTLSGSAVLRHAVIEAGGLLVVSGTGELTAQTEIRTLEDGLGTLEVTPSGSLRDLGYRDPGRATTLRGTQPGRIDRDAAAALVVSLLGAKTSAWNAADIRGMTEVILAATCLIADTAVRTELAEDVTDRALEQCTRLINRPDEPKHVRALSSARVLEVEGDIIRRLSRRASRPARRARGIASEAEGRGGRVDPHQR